MTVATVVWFVLIGAVIGVVARLLVPGPNPIGAIMTILVGIAGAVLGGVAADALGAGNVIALLFALIIAAVGVVLLTGFRPRTASGSSRPARKRRFF